MIDCVGVGFFKRGSVGVGQQLLARAHSGQNGNPMRTAVVVDYVGVGGGRGLQLGWPSVGTGLAVETAGAVVGCCVVCVAGLGPEQAPAGRCETSCAGLGCGWSGIAPVGKLG